MSRLIAAVAISTVTMVSVPGIACADPAVPQQDTPCAVDLDGTMTWPTDAKMPLRCVGQQWTLVTTPPPPNDRWLSYGPAMTLHGQGMRNPSVESGEWTATPQDQNSQCRADQQAVVDAGVLGPIQTSEGEPGHTLSFQIVPQLFSIEMRGYCLWTRQG